MRENRPVTITYIFY